jgi:glycosyltransferase involved in cell wall biosynthesis
LIKGAAYVMKVSDLASDVALATGIMKPGFAIRLARMFEAFSYRKAKAVICVCQGFIDRLRERGVSEEKLHLIPDWGDTENLRPGEAGSAFRLANQLSTKQFLVFHTGNMGKKQRLMNVVNAAEASRNERDLKWIIVGQGEEKSQLEEEISRRGLTNTMMLPLQPAELLTGMYGSADLLLLNQAAAVEDAVIPSKLLTYMGAAQGRLRGRGSARKPGSTCSGCALAAQRCRLASQTGRQRESICGNSFHKGGSSSPIRRIF